MDYRYNENTLMHSVGINLHAFGEILKYGIYSHNLCEKENIESSRNFIGYNMDDYISTVKYEYINLGKNLAYDKYIANGITFIFENVDYVSSFNELYINQADEVLIKDKVPVDKIKAIAIPEKLSTERLSNLIMIPTETTSYYVIKNSCEELKNYIDSFSVMDQDEQSEYNDLMKCLKLDFIAVSKDITDLELLNDLEELKLDINYFLAELLEDRFNKLLGKDSTTLYEAVDYINKKVANLPLFVKNYRERGKTK